MHIPKDSWERYKWMYKHVWVWKDSTDGENNIWKEWSYFINFLKGLVGLCIFLPLGSFGIYISLLTDHRIPFFSGSLMLTLSFILVLFVWDGLDTMLWYRGGANYGDASSLETIIARLFGKYFDEKRFVESRL